MIFILSFSVGSHPINVIYIVCLRSLGFIYDLRMFSHSYFSVRLSCYLVSEYICKLFSSIPSLEKTGTTFRELESFYVIVIFRYVV